MRNTWVFPIALILLIASFITCYGYESIKISPPYIYNDTSKIVLQYNYKNEHYDTYDLTLSVDSSNIVFKNNTVHIPYIEKNKLLTINITGYIVSYSQPYLIVVYKKYLLDGTPISGIHLVKVYRVNNRSTDLGSEEVKENIILLDNETERETVNESEDEGIEEVFHVNVSKNTTSIITVDINKTTAPITVENKTSELSVNITRGEEKDTNWEINISEDTGKKENISSYNQSESEITSHKRENYMLYIILGVISGIIIGLIAIYILSL